MLKACGVCYIVYHTAAVRATIECRGKTLEPLLTCGVPYLEDTDLIVLKNNFSIGKVSTYGWLKMGGELPLLEKVDQ